MDGEANMKATAPRRWLHRMVRWIAVIIIFIVVFQLLKVPSDLAIWRTVMAGGLLGVISVILDQKPPNTELRRDV
jgi:hypothetical protein